MTMKENEIQVLGYDPKKTQREKHWIGLVLAACILLILGWLVARFAIRESQNQAKEIRYGECTLDTTLQASVDSLLKEKMMEINAQSGQAIVMEVQSGEIKAMVGLQKRFDGEYEPCRNFGHQQESSLIKPVSALVLLEDSMSSLDTRVETGSGIYNMHGRLLKDHNWHRGGYGLMSLGEALQYSSNVGVGRLVDEAYEDCPQRFFDMLERMGLGNPDTLVGVPELKPMCFTSPKDSCWTKSKLAWSSIGYERLISPLQVLTFYNAIANDGRMVSPMLFRTDTIVIKPQIASRKNIEDMQMLLHHVVTEGLGRMAETEVVDVAGYMGSTQVSQGTTGDSEEYNDCEYRVEFCGFFPVRNPRYSIIVSMNKIGYPASGGGQAGPVFRQIVENMCKQGM